MSNDGLIIENMDLSHIHLAAQYFPFLINHIKIKEETFNWYDSILFVRIKQMQLYKELASHCAPLFV